MINVEYISSEGKKYSLQTNKSWITDGTFHKRSWKQNQKAFKRESVTYDLTLTIRGTLEERITFLNELGNSMDKDVEIGNPGKIYVNGEYIKGFFIESESAASENKNCWTENKLKFYCPDACWITETEYSFKAQNKISTDNKIYPLKYPFRYANGMENTYIINPHFTDANFLLRIYGPSVNPLVNIGGYPYLVNTVLEKGEYLEINSLEGTVEKTMNDGERINIFHTRAKGAKSVFKKIPAGRQNITWPGEFDFDLIIYEERSEPKWNG